jgi:hypothetical protein
MNMYKNLVRECEAIGLHIVASVCDQGVKFKGHQSINFRNKRSGFKKR